MEQNRKRIIGGALFLGALTLLLCARLFYIQILCHAELAAAARAQYETALVGIDDRGQIFDRDLRPLTGGKYRYYYIISKETCKAAAAVGQLNTLLAEIGAERITLRSARYEVYRAEIFDAAVHRQLQEQFGAYAFRGRTRYQSSQSACHLIGYLNEDEQRGVSGLELLCEETLQAKGSKLILESDAAGRLLFGIAPQKVKAAGSSAANARTNDADGAANAGNAAIGQGNIVTTLDLRVQQNVRRCWLASAAQRASRRKRTLPLSLSAARTAASSWQRLLIRPLSRSTLRITLLRTARIMAACSTGRCRQPTRRAPFSSWSSPRRHWRTISAIPRSASPAAGVRKSLGSRSPARRAARPVTAD